MNGLQYKVKSYLYEKIKEVSSKIKDDISYIQNLLYKEFSIDESLSDETGRRVYTYFMTRLG